MTEQIFVQLAPIPYGLRPPAPLEQLALAADGRTDKLTAFLEGEKAAFESWALGVPAKQTAFNIVQGSDTKFALFAGPIPDVSDTGVRAERFRSLIDGIYTGAVYGDTGTELSGVPFSTRGRWTVNAATEPKMCEGPRITLTALKLLTLGFCAAVLTVLAAVVLAVRSLL